MVERTIRPVSSRRVSEATRAVAALDPAMAALIRRAGPCSLTPSRDADGGFAELIRGISSQQIAGAEAAAIHGRFRALVPGELTSDAVLALSEESMRGAGLSAAKTASIRDLAAKVDDGTVPLRQLGRMPDEEIVERLTTVRGIGRWTAEMFLVFHLARLDVWPVDDLGVRSGFALTFGIDPAPTARQLRPMGDRFRPYRTIITWYAWQALRLSRGQPLR